MTPSLQADERPKHDNRQNETNWTHVLLASAITLSIAFFWFIRPAQQHISRLERTCSRLAVAVDQLTEKCASVERGSSVLELMDEQGQLAAKAERAVTHIDSLRRQILSEASRLDSTTRATQDSLAAVERNSLRTAKMVEDCFKRIDTLHAALLRGRSQLAQAAPVMEDVNGLLTDVVEATPNVEAAIAAADRSASLCQDLIDDQAAVAEAETAADRMLEFCSRIQGGSSDVEASQAHLDKLIALKESVVAETKDLQEATASLARLLELRAGLLQAEGTIGRVQHMLVDVMMLRPALDRALDALGPAIQLSRREQIREFETSIAAEKAERSEAEAEVASTPTPATK